MAIEGSDTEGDLDIKKGQVALSSAHFRTDGANRSLC